MKAFLSAVVVALVVAVGAAYVLDGSFQRASFEANTSRRREARRSGPTTSWTSDARLGRRL
jgi:hypothetical protein